MRHKYLASLSAFLATAILIAGCSGGSSDTQSTGRISLAVSDGPIHDATKVCITFNEIEFRRGSESTIVTLDPPEKINLLAFQGANAAPLLINQELPAGNYQWMRLGIDAARGANGSADGSSEESCEGEGSYIVLSTGTHNLVVPSGQENGLRLVSGFTVPSNGSADFTAEFDLMKSITAPNGQADVTLRPTIRLVDNVDVGTLTGVVSNQLATANECEPSVFVFDEGVTPNPIDEEGDDEEDPVATALVAFEDVEFEYVVGYLLAGNYNVAFTCDGETFEPSDGKPIMISAGEIAEADFP